MAKKIETLLYETLIEKKLVEKKVIESLKREVEHTQESLSQLLVKRGLVPEEEILKIFSHKLHIPYRNLGNVTVERSVVAKVPSKVALYYKFMPLDITNEVLSVAVSSPLDIKIRDEIRTQLGFDIDMVLAKEEEISELMRKHYGAGIDTLDRLVSQASVTETPAEEAIEKVDNIEKMAEDASVVRLVNQIIVDAYKKRATDIHLEPYRGEVRLRYRIDGLLYDAKAPKEIKHFLPAIISRIKIMTNLNIVEHRLPQDGRTVVRTQDQVLDLRISIIPTPNGESVVIRILPTQLLFSLEKLGLSKADLGLIESLIRKPHGIIFLTGPTGSGKTTTLYASLSRINTKERKIITIEDPIEYELQGVTQIQVNPAIGLDFARGLRSILRHDPDIIMVGEVRDLETAEIAIRVALTGHLVFSTLHTNDAPSGITRLLDIGIEPYLVASSIEAFIAQRLVRVNCPHCKYEDTSGELLEVRNQIARDVGLNSVEEVKVLRGKGCPRCNDTGFFGRTALYEILLVNDDIKELILKRQSSSEIKRRAIAQGMRTLRQDGWFKVLKGVTTPEEVMHITPAESMKTVFSQGEEKTERGDRRIYLRLNAQITVRYRLFKSQDELSKSGFTPEYLSTTKNISAGGLLFVANESLPIGGMIEVTLQLPDKYTITCLAKVVRITQHEEYYDIGVCFLDISSGDRAKLEHYVQERVRD